MTTVGERHPLENRDPAVDRWFLPGTGWSNGNLVRPLVHGATYFRALHDELQQLQAGDRVYFTDWRGDPDERLLPDGPTVGGLLCALAERGVEVRGLVWRSHSDLLRFSSSENEHLGAELNEAGGEVLLDQRVRWFGSHHQKLVVIRHRDAQERDVAYVGGIDLCHGRRDDAEHAGDPQPQPFDRKYGPRPPWHDATLEIRGPAVGDVLRTFVQRWDDPHPLDRRTPYRMLLHKLARMPRHPEQLPERFPDPPPAGPHAVQLLRTYGRRRPPYPFAPNGERTVARAYGRAFAQARSLIYLEDQYLWSVPVARGIADALRKAPELRLLAVVPRYPDADDAFTGPPNRLGQLHAMQVLQEVAPDRAAFFDLENRQGVPIYVHAKICVVDDVWFTCGSDNFNRRSWTNDSELTCAVLDPTLDGRPPADLSSTGDGARRLARSLRLQTWAEHLGLPEDAPELLDPARAWDLWGRTADALDAWHAGGR
ncbi:MAG: phospholipase, partial [Actinomycetota bacterium]|nr:phospholipase [Actinomycetota bacterium]